MSGRPPRLVEPSLAAIDALSIQVVDEQADLGDVDAIVLEDDTFHVLSADPEWRPVAEHPLHMLAAAAESQPDALGSVVVVEQSPLRLCAVIHDLDREPSCDRPAIAVALARIQAIAEQRGLERIALPLLGTVHGRVPLAEAIEILRLALARTDATTLHHLVLPVAAKQVDRVRVLLASSLR